MTCRCAPALLQLRTEINLRYPGRDKASDGCCGDAAHAARKSDHNPDASGYAHAEDIDENIINQIDPEPLWDLGVTLLADKRTKYLIYEARILYPDGTNRPYTGINAHRHHLHISIKPGTEHDTRVWLATLDHPAPPAAPAVIDLTEELMGLVTKDANDARAATVRRLFLDLLIREPSPTELGDRMKELERDGLDAVTSRLADSAEGKKVLAGRRKAAGI